MQLRELIMRIIKSGLVYIMIRIMAARLRLCFAVKIIIVETVDMRDYTEFCLKLK